MWGTKKKHLNKLFFVFVIIIKKLLWHFDYAPCAVFQCHHVTLTNNKGADHLRGAQIQSSASGRRGFCWQMMAKEAQENET